MPLKPLLSHPPSPPPPPTLPTPILMPLKCQVMPPVAKFTFIPIHSKYFSKHGTVCSPSKTRADPGGFLADLWSANSSWLIGTLVCHKANERSIEVSQFSRCTSTINHQWISYEGPGSSLNTSNSQLITDFDGTEPGPLLLWKVFTPTTCACWLSCGGARVLRPGSNSYHVDSIK